MLGEFIVDRFRIDEEMTVVPESEQMPDDGMVMSTKSLAMAYVPEQKWRKIYDTSEGFERGTIFEELDLPFKGYGGETL